MIQRYGTVNKAGEKMQRKYVKKGLPEGKKHFVSSKAHVAERVL